MYNSIDLSPELKKHWFFRTGSLLPFFELLFLNSATICILLPQVICTIASVFPPLVVSVASVRVCAYARNQRSMVAKSRKADRHAVVYCHSPVISVSLACDHVVQAASGLERREQVQP